MIFLYVFVSLVVIYFIACYFIFNFIFLRKKDLEWTSSKALEKTPWKEFSNIISNAIKWLENNNAKDVSITSYDGTKLLGKWIETENAKGTIIVVHGYKGNYISDFGLVFDVYKNLGFNILTFRHRAHGESQGKYITMGVKEHKDLLSVIDFHNKTFGNCPIFISGISMGASTAMFIADKDIPSNVKGISSDSGFTSPYDIISKVIKDKLKISGKFLMPGINFWCKTLGKFSMKECNSLKILKNAKVPILFIHGEKDDFVPCEMSKKSYEACTSWKDIVLVKEAGHGTSYLFDQDKVKSSLTNFFNNLLK